MDAKTHRPVIYVALLAANLIYACESVFVKLASVQPQFSIPYFAYMAGAVFVLGIYAVIWQQIIKRIPVSEAYMFKGTALIFVLLISALFLGETITVWNILGAAMIVGGIILFAKS